MNRPTWAPELYEAAVGAGVALCTEHNGRHSWELLGPNGPDDGYCAGLLREQMQARRAGVQQAREDGDGE